MRMRNSNLGQSAPSLSASLVGTKIVINFFRVSFKSDITLVRKTMQSPIGGASFPFSSSFQPTLDKVAPSIIASESGTYNFTS